MKLFKFERWERGLYQGYLIVCADTMEMGLGVCRIHDKPRRREFNYSFPVDNQPDTVRIGVICEDEPA